MFNGFLHSDWLYSVTWHDYQLGKWHTTESRTGHLHVFWCAHKKIHVKNRYCIPYQEKTLRNYGISNHATENTKACTISTANDKHWVNTSRLMFFKERNPTISYILHSHFR